MLDIINIQKDINNNSRFLNLSYEPISLFINVLIHEQQGIFCWF